ncbi:MAG: choice-of-anchor U domain-containing protein, partial [Acidobacteriota bacterium]
CVGLTCDLDNVTAPQMVTAEFIIEDFDGVPADVENAGPNFGDGNGDGIPDAEQSDVASLPASHGGGYLSVELSGACSQLNEVQTPVAITSDPDGYAYPFGLLGFSLPCETATVTVLYHGIESLAGLTYRKHGPNPPGSASEIWYSMPGAVFGTTTVFGETVATATFDLADNALGDATGDDGQIVDPGGPGLPLAAIPTLGPLGLMILCLLLGAAGVILRHRSSQSSG